MIESSHYLECRACGAGIDCLVDLAEQIVDVPEQCPECGARISDADQERAYDEGLQDALGLWTDRAMDLLSDS